MKTTYWTKLKWLHDINWKEWELEFWPLIFTVRYKEYGVNQREVFLSSPFFNADDNAIYFNYLTDEFGWHETLEKAKRAVETFLSNELKIDFDFLDCNHI